MNKEIQKYTELYDNLKAPEQWKTDIKALMREELAKNNNNIDNNDDMQKIDSGNQNVIDIQSKKRFSNGYKKIIAIGTIAAAIIFICVVRMMDQPRFITPMNDGSIQSEVALKDTNLYFEIQDSENDNAVFAGKQDGDQDSVVFEIDEETGEVVINENKPDTNIKPSYIKGVPVYLTITMTDAGYQFTAIYEKDGENIEITRVGITQKEFIKLLYKEI